MIAYPANRARPRTTGAAIGERLPRRGAEKETLRRLEDGLYALATDEVEQDQRWSARAFGAALQLRQMPYGEVEKTGRTAWRWGSSAATGRRLPSGGFLDILQDIYGSSV